jgi:glycogen phosphorylase
VSITGGPSRSITISDIPSDPSDECASLYDKLEAVVVPMYYGRPSAYGEVMRSAISVNGSFFNTHRMLDQYVSNAYFPRERASGGGVAADRGQ